MTGLRRILDVASRPLLAAWLACVLVLAPLLGHAQSLQPVPPLAARVTDTTGTLAPDAVASLESQLAAIEQRKGAQVAVLMVASTAPESIEQYSIRVVEAWKIGRGSVDGKKVDDGVLVLVAKNDRRIRIEVGYGLEGAIPDALAKRIIAETISPRFKQGDFAGGLQAGVAEVGRLIEGEALPAPWQPGHPADGELTDNLLAVGLFVLVGGMIATRVLGRFLGSAAGGVGAGFLGTAIGLPLLAGAGIGVAAFLFLLVFSAMGGALSPVGRHTYRSGPVIFPGGFGGGRGGGGGGGWGGGGGSFGGGGASGDW